MSHKYFFVPLVLIISVLFGACVSSRPSKDVYITDEISVDLISPSLNDNCLELHQLISGSYGGEYEDFLFETFLVLDSEQVNLMVMSPTGQTICNIAWNGDEVFLKSTFIPIGNLKGEYIIADLQFVLYPEEVVKAHLEKAGLAFNQYVKEGFVVREIHDGDFLVWSCLEKDNTYQIVNHLRRYIYNLETLV